MKRPGQSLMEYVIVFSIVVGAIIIASRLIRPKVQSSYNSLKTQISDKL